MDDFRITRASQAPTQAAAWGDLTWWASRALGNSSTQTVGRCRLRPGMANPRHRHPDCGEVLVVMAGRILHTDGDGGMTELGPGDSIAIARGVFHQARAIGSEVAELFISFDSADRRTEGE